MKRSERGFTLVEIMIVVAIIALLAAIAIPNVLRGRATANESAAIGNMRALISSMEMYRSVYQAYPDAVGSWSTDVYGPVPAFGPPAFNIAMDGSVAVQGFSYEYVPGAAPTSTYVLRATPVTLGSTGTRTFFTNESGQVFHCTGSSASDTLPGTADSIDQTPQNCT